MNNKLLNYLKCIFVIQYMVQCANVYGSRFGFWHWAKIIFPVFIIYTTPIFNAFDEKQSHLMKKSRPSVSEGVMFLVASLCLVDGQVAITGISVERHLLQLLAGLIHAGSLRVFFPNDTLAFSNYMKVPLAESVLALALVWATYITFFFAVFPVLTTDYRRVIFELYPCIIQAIFCWAIGLGWMLTTIYAHHRVQVVADSRRCGVWEVLATDTPSPSGGKVLAWKSGAQYHRGDVVTSSSKLYRLESPHSSYHLPPSASASSGLFLRLRERLHGILVRDSGPACRSTVLSMLMGCMLALCAVMVALALSFPRQQQRGFLLMAFMHAALVRQFSRTFLGSYTSTAEHSPCPSFVYNPYGHVLALPQQGSPRAASLSLQSQGRSQGKGGAKHK